MEVSLSSSKGSITLASESSENYLYKFTAKDLLPLVDYEIEIKVTSFSGRFNIQKFQLYFDNQKPNVENINKQLRLFFPKGKTIDTYTKQDIKNFNKTLLNRPLKSLDSYTPKQAFINVFDEDLFNKLF